MIYSSVCFRCTPDNEIAAAGEIFALENGSFDSFRSTQELIVHFRNYARAIQNALVELIAICDADEAHYNLGIEQQAQYNTAMAVTEYSDRIAALQKLDSETWTLVVNHVSPTNPVKQRDYDLLFEFHLQIVAAI